MNISDIPSYIGQNKWSVTGAFERLLKKLVPEQYSEALNTLETRKKELVNTVKDLDVKLANKEIDKVQHTEQKAVIQESIKKTEERHTKVTISKEDYLVTTLGEKTKDILSSSKSNDYKKRELTKLIDVNVTREVKDNLQSDIKTLVNTSHGTKTEDYTIQTFEKEHNVVLDKSQKFYKSEFFTLGGLKFIVGGKMDGIDHNGECVVEIKNRTRGLFNELRDYEETQINLYMYLLGYPRAKLVEMYKTKRTVKKNEIDVVYSKETTEEIKRRLVEFCKGMLRFVESTNLVDYLVKSDNEKENEIWSIIDAIDYCEESGVVYDDTVCMIESNDSERY